MNGSIRYCTVRLDPHHTARQVPGTAKSIQIYIISHMPCSALFLSCHQWWFWWRMREFSDDELATIAITPWGLAYDWNVANSHSHAWYVPCQVRVRQNKFCFDRAWHVPGTCLAAWCWSSLTESAIHSVTTQIN